MNRNLVEIALHELGAEDRALLELSVVRRVSDEDIAGLLGVDIGHVLIRREEALGRVSALIGEDPEVVLRTLRNLPSARWRDGEPPRQAEPEPEPEPEPASEPDPEPAPRPPAEKPDDQGRFLLALLGGVAVTVVVVVVLALTGDDNDPAEVGERPPAEQPAGGGGGLAPLTGARGSGSARIQDGRLTLTVRGLPDVTRGGYVVWLYDSVTEARAVAGFRRGNARVRARLPEGYRRYRFIDVSRERPDGNSNHSGQSVLRVPMARVAGG